VTEINFDLDPITPQGISTASCDKLSQRNLAIDNSENPGSPQTHRVQHTFAIHPTTSQPLPKQGPDELMISWGNTPPGTIATIYLPGVRVSEVLDLAARNFNLQTLERVDDHTLRCRTAGVTYVPIPAGGAVDLAGLITLDLPSNIRKGQTFRIVVRQVVDTPAPQPTPPPQPAPAPRIAAQARAQSVTAAAVERAPTSSRHIVGAFQFSILVETASDILPGDERNLRVIERVAATIPPENRWYPVFQRYISQLGGRVKALGGEPDHGGEPGRVERRFEYEGKVSGLLFDRFGDFEGFWLDTEEGKRRFHSREKHIEELVRAAWARRVPILVIVAKEDREKPQTIVLLRPPVEL